MTRPKRADGAPEPEGPRAATPSPGTLLPAAFFARPAAEVARELLGKYVVSTVDGHRAGGRVIEAEAYLGPEDPGSHAATRAITARNAVMYAAPGTAYVYFTYGQHHMLNLIAQPEGVPGGVLIRAVEPTIGLDTIRRRRGGVAERALTDGPGKVAQALGLTLDDNGVALGEGRLVVLDGPVPSEPVCVSGRVGLTEGHELPLRFYLGGHPGVSHGRTGPAPRQPPSATNHQSRPAPGRGDGPTARRET
jgi:DNA-3-methyladenine glycosylase